jgi:3-deoxy-7-phosphoheptulonate synthase
MIVVMCAAATDAQVDGVREHLEGAGVRTVLARNGRRALVGCPDGGAAPDERVVARCAGVESVASWTTPYRLAGRDLVGPEGRTLVRIGDGPGAVVGGRELAVIAGPCAVEGEAILRETAWGVRRAGAGALRGGAFKPRTSPYAFQGLGRDALGLLAAVRRETGLAIVTEVLDPRQVDAVAAHADVLQVGARNMQNFPLLAELGRLRRPVLLKRGLSATVAELLLAAEYILARGNGDVILCERGIRTFSTAGRSTLDVAAIPVLRRETHLPVLVDPSHAAGRADLVPALAYASIAAGADGLLVEVHARPEAALSDREQSLSLEAFDDLMRGLRPFAEAAGRTCAGPRGSRPREAVA